MHPTLSSSADVVLTAFDLEVGYAERPLLAPLELTIRPGDFWCVLGRNGAGKSTLVRTLLGLMPPLAGNVYRPVGLRQAYLPQRARLDELYPMSARDVVLMGTERGGTFLRRRAPEASALCQTVLERLELQPLASQRYRNLSEGQKQRVLLARAMASSPQLAFFDEPTSAMDALAERAAYEALAELCASRASAVVLVTHDLTLARKYADHALFIDDVAQRAVAGTPPEVFSHPALKQRFGFASVEETSA